MSYPDTPAARLLRASLAQKLSRDGDPRSPEWRKAVEETPRHVYVPSFYRQTNGVWESVTPDDPDYLDAVYSDTSLTTQVRDGRATSSSSQPSLMLDMLEALDVEDGHTVGEVATGTGYNGGLICHRVGDRNLVTLEVDSELSRLARSRLAACGYAPEIVTGDAREGFPGGTTLDRLIVTCGFDTFPYALARQMRPRGVVVCPLGWGNVRLEVLKDGVLEGRFLPRGSYFMKVRDEGASGSVAYPGETGAPLERATEVDPALLAGDEVRFLRSLVLGDHAEATEQDAAGDTVGLRIWCADGSLAQVEGARVRQTGPRRLWDAVEAAYGWYRSHGRPHRARFGATVTSEGQHFWLDEPAQAVPVCR